ncbi:MAG: PEP-CTERM sorting domain-containing protein [Verrucomicrobiae bacterium]|nr:PEP-CTERM sorting domain-containing protein [Verrucomicrobiae bacterium]
MYLIIVSIALNLSLVCSTWAQSSFELANKHTPLVNAPVFDAQGELLSGPQYLAELWGGTTADSLTPLVDIAQGFRREMAPFISPGYFFSPSAYLSGTNVPPLGFAWLQVRVWDTSLGATYEEVAGLAIGGYGESPLFYAQGRNPLLAPPDLPGPLIGLQSFSLLPVVPEPSTWVLLALGGATLRWVVRRQRLRKP